MTASFSTPVSEVKITTFEKKSRFITRIIPVTSKQEALSYLLEITAFEVGANHNCSAFIIGSPLSPQDIYCSDDGEPSGTAGKPLLSILQHESIGNVLVVVSRFFGGVKLGTGGLVRAYSNALKAALQEVTLQEYVIKQRVTIGFDYRFEAAVRRKLEEFGAAIETTEYGVKVFFGILVEDNLFDAFFLELQDLTAGDLTLKKRA